MPGASSLLLGLRQVFQDPGRCVSLLSCVYVTGIMLAHRLHCEAKIPEVSDAFGESTSAR